MIYTTNILILPLLILLWTIDVWVLAASIPCLDVYADCDQLENPHTRYRQEKAETLELLSYKPPAERWRPARQ